jgi:hypothetical protein
MKKTEPEPINRAGRRYLTSRSLRARYDDRSARQIRRWIDQKIIPEPDLRVNGHDFWLEENLDKNDARLAAEASNRLQASHFTTRDKRAAMAE